MEGKGRLVRPGYWSDSGVCQWVDLVVPWGQLGSPWAVEAASGGWGGLSELAGHLPSSQLLPFQLSLRKAEEYAFCLVGCYSLLSSGDPGGRGTRGGSPCSQRGIGEGTSPRRPDASGWRRLGALCLRSGRHSMAPAGRGSNAVLWGWQGVGMGIRQSWGPRPCMVSTDRTLGNLPSLPRPSWPQP